EPLREAGWIGTIHHGLPLDLLSFDPGPGKYLAFLGRIAREKRVDRAIAIATACGQPLRIAAKVDPADREYFEDEIRPLLDNPLVEFIGEITEDEKGPFLGQAIACGVPVVAFRGGSVPEVIDDGVTGFIVDSLEDAIAATRNVHHLDRRR